MNRYVSTLVVTASLGIGQLAFAATQTSNFQVTAIVGTTCTIAVPASLAFGTYDPLSPSALNGSTTLNINCTASAPVTIDINEGTTAAAGSSPAVPQRQMASGLNRLKYFLYQDAGLTTIWGAGASTQNYVGTGASQALTIFGQIPAAQAEPAGAFADPVIATVTF